MINDNLESLAMKANKRELTDSVEGVGEHSVEVSDIDLIRRSTLQVLTEQNRVIEYSGERVVLPDDDWEPWRLPSKLPLKYEQSAVKENSEKKADSVPESDSTEQDGLTEEQKEQIRREQGWSDEIINAIRNMEQYEVYKKAELKEVEINGRKYLVKKDFDPDYRNSFNGKSNRELIAEGHAPYDRKTGEKLEWHHMAQKVDSPLAQLTTGEHDKNHKILHPAKESDVHKGENKSEWNDTRKDLWNAFIEKYYPEGGNT